MSDKRSVTTDALETLGTAPLPDSAGRDAIHLAVEPAIAACPLNPGDHVARLGNGQWVQTLVGQGLGIVDPFLSRSIKEGERFWVVVYPRQITSLRHVWSHPGFPDAEPDRAMPDSEVWLRAYAMRMNSYDKPEEAFNRLIEGLKTNELFAHGSDLHGRFDIDDEEVLREHAEKYLGRSIDFGKFEFSCSC